ncbi:1-(5-phosphoribosyl)-5-[(5-phosphoribosylamino)methylideneamino]imidazole-4-carboxamide isomerase [Synechocystis sp. FACHB-383]|uniref:1-(5-phosphoribosyl)-5-[(5- phosphoribosylamino)methylideneamino]imidazole-4- carboxamide isomerase n=1 Tax=Synechocystis sp. FACHB-383 TaxID=2692864 RepID=UPI001682EAEC|nr:1-(5-phosphoribosyl)-5-[(5-phosphoribosylamino)methylideneamino]imidazole-4-carboxamide isomerase [Synechocystis sp. FACHB-383]MBD2654426.1 1-(5-phosphoribosyl)-5-[(5-phosphoribosylamino)methylideneamino]imidazole-4-carboxamide isomerase [Synechocystis sp. FACHB-383]
MEILPAIDLLGGKCVRLYQGDYDQSQVYHEDPVAVARQWQAQGASRLHLVDLDGAKEGQPVNLTAIAKIVESLNIPVQVGGGLRDRARVKQLLDLGVNRVILGTIAVENPDLVGELCTEFPGQIVVGIDARNGKVATRGWLETSTVEAGELAQRMEKLGAAAIIYTDIHRDGTMAGPNLEALKQLAGQLTIPVIASGGVSQVQDLLNLLSLESLGVNGVIIGKALYTGDIQLETAIRAVGNGRWQDVPPSDFPRLG